MIYKNDNGFDVAAVSDNERYLVLTQNLTTSSNNIYLVDQQTKQTKKINPDSVEKSVGHEVTFDHDVTDPDVLRRELLRHSTKVAARLRSHCGRRGRRSRHRRTDGRALIPARRLEGKSRARVHDRR